MIIEYLGLPGVGKSSLARAAENAEIVSTGRGLEKAINTLTGFVLGFRTVVPLVHLLLKSPRKGIRPVMVVLERSGRISRLQKSDVTTHLDEGVLQFIWRFLCDHELNQQTVRAMHHSLASLSFRNRQILYVSCGRDRHLQQLRQRNKGQPFDQSALSGDHDYIQRCRDWMAVLLRAMRAREVEVRYCRVGAS